MTISQSGFDLTPPSARARALEAGLNDEERRVLLHHGTEAPFCGGLLNQKKAGRLLLPPLRAAAVPPGHKVRERHRLAQLHRPIDPQHVVGIEDNSYGMRRIETRCARCDSHQGHVFPDGPRRPAAALLHQLGVAAIRGRWRNRCQIRSDALAPREFVSITCLQVEGGNARRSRGPKSPFVPDLTVSMSPSATSSLRSHSASQTGLEFLLAPP
jgi:peptide-methionine (R)-S-oxide reductase